MKVTREAILDLLGKGNAYHSCVLTTYNFDPRYFEVQLLRILRRAGIRNVLVLLDGVQYASMFQEEGASDLRANGSYGVWPVFQKGAYHPKLILAIGSNSGLMAVGSGNLTSGGHGSNDEIWSAFHATGDESENAPFFADAWRMIQGQAAGATGSVRERLDWVAEQAPWLAGLNAQRAMDVDVGDQLVSFITGPEDHLFELFQERIGRTAVKRITIASPYFDRQGAILAAWVKAWPKAEVHAIVDDQLGVLPVGLQAATSNRVQWHRWAELPGLQDAELETKRRRLHAKVMVMELADGRELAYVGSANLSVAAWGLPGVAPRNSEAGIILERRKQGLTNDLGLPIANWPKLSLKDLGPGRKQDDRYESDPVAWTVHLMLAESDGVELSIQADRELASPCRLVLENASGTALFEAPLDKFPQRLTLNVAQPHLGARCKVLGAKGKTLSNTLLVQDRIAHQRCNPDPKQARWQAIQARAEAGEQVDVDELIQFALSIQFQDDLVVAAHHRAARMERARSEEQGERLSSYEEFTKVDEQTMARQRGLMNHPRLLIADLLASFELNLDPQVMTDDAMREQERDLASDDDDPQQEELVREYSFTEQDREQNAVRRFLKRYAEHIAERAVDLPRSGERDPLSLLDQSNFLIASWLMLTYTAKQFKDAKGQETGQLFLHLKGDSYWDNLRSFTVEVLTDHLATCLSDRTHYELDSLNRKLDMFTRESFSRAMLLIVCQHWGEWEKDLFDHLALNLLYAMYRQGMKPSRELLDELLAATEGKPYYRSKDLEANMHRLKRLLRHTFSGLIRAKENGKLPVVEASGLRKGALIFRTPTGFCQVERVIHREGAQRELYLKRLGDMEAQDDPMIMSKAVLVAIS